MHNSNDKRDYLILHRLCGEVFKSTMLLGAGAQRAIGDADDVRMLRALRGAALAEMIAG